MEFNVIQDEMDEGGNYMRATAAFFYCPRCPDSEIETKAWTPICPHCGRPLRHRTAGSPEGAFFR